MNKVHDELSVGSAFLGEVMGTFLLVWTVIMTAVNNKSIAGNHAPIAIGWAVALAHIMLIPFTGCGINPARSFGPMIVVIMTGGKAGFDGWWVYYVAPFVGSGLAVVVCKYLFQALDDEDKNYEIKDREMEATKAVPTTDEDDGKPDADA
jgi:glycerol uptake facilitator-like aquaporin